MTVTQTGPLRAVLDAFGSGVSARADICRVTGVPRDVVDAAIDHLVRVGRISGKPLSIGCSDRACGGCAFTSIGPAGGCFIAPRPG